MSLGRHTEEMRTMILLIRNRYILDDPWVK